MATSKVQKGESVNRRIKNIDVETSLQEKGDSMTYKDRECCECKTIFTPKVYNSLVCENKDCYDSLRSKRAKAKRVADKKRDISKCSICGDEFLPYTKKSKVCNKPECQKEKIRLQSAKDRKRRMERKILSGEYVLAGEIFDENKHTKKYKKAKLFNTQMVCEVCKKTYTSKSRKRITCYNKKCIKEHRNAHWKESGRDKEERRKYAELARTAEGAEKLRVISKRKYEAAKLTGSYARKNIRACALTKKRNDGTVSLSMDSGVYRTLWSNEEDLKLFELKESCVSVEEIAKILKRTILAISSRWSKIKEPTRS